MADWLAIDAEYTGRRIREMLDAYPELMDDDDLRSDTLEGETDLHAVMSRLVRARMERLAMAGGIAEYIGDLEARKQRYERGAQGIKSLMMDLMQTAGIDKLPLPEATLSIAKPRAKVEVHTVEDLPQGFVTFEPVPNKAAIKSALDAGEAVPGASLVYGDPTLTVRTK